MSKKKVFILIFLTLFMALFFALRSTWSSLPISMIKELRPSLPYLLGQNKPTTYIFLLGNDTEIRANGGFTGSYAKISISSPPISSVKDLKTKIKDIKMNFSFHDIYVPAGQISSYVKPPDAVQQAFGKGSWDLSNADFNPHFPSAATSIRWFLEKGKETNPDILGIMNLSTIKKVFDIVGQINLPGSDIIITPDNLYLYLQGKAEVNFFPGSTQKADALHSVGTATLKKMNSLSLSKKIQIAKTLYEDLTKQNIVLNSTDQSFQNFLENKNFAGIYKPQSFDHYGLVELNLGANKANQFVERQTSHKVYLENNLLKHEVDINFQNSSPEKNPNPPLHYGGHYIGYFRFFLPSAATNIQVNHTEYLPCQEKNIDPCYQATSSSDINQTVLENQNPKITNCSLIDHTNQEANTDICSFSPAGFNIISFWHITLAGQHTDINLSYNLPQIDPKDFSLNIIKQNGFSRSSQALNIFGKSLQTNLETHFLYPQQ